MNVKTTSGAVGSQRPMHHLARRAFARAAPFRGPAALVRANAAASTESPGISTATAPPKMSGAEIRERFLTFFEERSHTRMPSSSLVPEDPTVLLTIAGMLQFKPIFLGQTPPKVPCATTTQKCVRTNDIENVGVTARHHTFFEMLGNFSFGDYFKKEAISFAWELSTKVFGLPVERVWVSVYEEDDEAYNIWKDVIGVAPERIKRMGAADNFWASGPTGPCGPCSELYYDFHPERGLAEDVSLEDDSRFIEFYNLVFMQLNRNSEGELEPLAKQNIDTGMGLERMAQILQGVPNNYETDLIFPIVQKAAEVAGIDYHKSDEITKTALKVIGDHTRAVAYLISDGVTPSNVGRGYIVRRLLRRVVMKGRLLGIKDIFTPSVAEVAMGMSAGCDPAVSSNASRITEVMAQEEKTFVVTLGRGQKILDELLAKEADISGADAFLLYDTFGFPLELTQEMAEQKGLKVDVDGFTTEMEAQRQRSKDSRDDIDLTAQASLGNLVGSVGATDFVGYTNLSDAATVKALIVEGGECQEAGPGTKLEVILDKTPFYAESGGQVADHGIIKVAGDDSVVLMVSDVKKAAGGSLFVHTAEVTSGTLKVGQQVTAEVDSIRRMRVRTHHTATHLLQSALKQVLGEDTCQQGSMCTFDRLRFDFNLPRAMTPEEVSEVERLVNGWVQQAVSLQTNVMDLSEAKAAGATAMFGEKYDDSVRVVNVPGISMELCGGTHVSNTAEIGTFKVLSESGIASGIRRMEAVVGAASVEYLNNVDSIVKGVANSLKVKQDEVPERVSSLQSELKSANKEIADLKAQLAVAKSSALAGDAVTTGKGFKILVKEMEGVDAKAMQEASVKLQATLGDNAAVILATKTEDGKVNFAAMFGPQVVEAKVQAGKVVGAIAKLCGGGGGGKPAQAQAGGKDASKMAEALELATKTLTEALS